MQRPVRYSPDLEFIDHAKGAIRRSLNGCPMGRPQRLAELELAK